MLTRYGFRLETVSETRLVLWRSCVSVLQLNGLCQLTSYGSFFLFPNEGIEPSFCVSAQWKMSWYSRGLSSFSGMLG